MSKSGQMRWAIISGGSDIATGLVADDRGVILHLAQANVEVVYGGYGNDVFVGGGADETLLDENVWKNAT